MMRKSKMRPGLISGVCTIALSSAAVAETNSVADFFVDQQSLRGQRIAVEGDVSCVNGSCSLEDDSADSVNSISFSWNRLAREDRVRLARCATNGAAKCHVTVAGIVPAEITVDTVQGMMSGKLGSIDQAVNDMVDDILVDSVKW
jgi:hypothetical protein